MRTDTMLAYITSHVDSLKARARKLAGDKRGVTALEYCLVAGVVVTTVMVGFQTMATALKNSFVDIGASL
jgi:Flp pilus assembly pilin Flp